MNCYQTHAREHPTAAARMVIKVHECGQVPAEEWKALQAVYGVQEARNLLKAMAVYGGRDQEQATALVDAIMAAVNPPVIVLTGDR